MPNILGYLELHSEFGLAWDRVLATMSKTKGKIERGRERGEGRKERVRDDISLPSVCCFTFVFLSYSPKV